MTDAVANVALELDGTAICINEPDEYVKGNGLLSSNVYTQLYASVESAGVGQGPILEWLWYEL